MRNALFILLFAVAASAAEPPETIFSHFYPKQGSEAQLEAVLRENIAIMKKLDVIEPAPIVLLRASDAKGHPVFVEVFTWRSASIPDDAPPEIKESWAKMNALVEKRDGHRGIEFEVVDLLK